MTIPSALVVPGDILLLETGDMVAADGRLLEVYGLTVNESSLTGESLGVEKHTGAALPKAAGWGRCCGRPDQHDIFRFPGDLGPCGCSGDRPRV